MQDGHIVEVRYVEYGSYLAADALISATEIVVEDASDFDEEGQLTLNSETYSISAIDYDTNTITLATGLLAAATEDDRVDIYPAVVEKQAVVVTGDDGDALTARVPHYLFSFLTEGILTYSDRIGCSVALLRDEWVVIDIHGVTPAMDATYIDPTNLPSNPSDGSAPGASPTPVVAGGIGAIHVRWTPVTNADPVTYEVHISTSTGFTPDSTTLYVETNGSSATIRKYSDGSDLAYDTDYYIVLIAKDDDGSAAAGTEVTARLVEITDADIAAAYVYAGDIVADQITGGTLSADITLSSLIKTAESGSRVEIGPAGIEIINSSDQTTISLPSDEAQTASFKGDVEAEGLTVLGGATFRSGTNELAREAVLSLQQGTTAPLNAPTLSVDWESLDLTGHSYDPADFKSLTYTTDGYFLVTVQDTNGLHFVRFTTAGAFYDVLASYETDRVIGSGTQITAGGDLYTIGLSGSACWIDRYPLSPGTPEFSDDFSGTLAGWDTVSNAVISAGALAVDTPGSSGLVSKSVGGGMQGHYVTIKHIADTTVENNWITFGASGWGGYIQFRVFSTTLYYRYYTGSVLYSASITYNATDHAYLRMRESDGHFYWDTSADGVTWTNRHSNSHSLTSSQLNTGAYIEMYVDGTATWDDVEYNSSDPASNSARYYRTNSTQYPVIGNDGSALLVYEFDDPNNRLVFNTVSTTTLAVTNTVNSSTNGGFRGPLNAALKGTFDFGATKHIAGPKDTGTYNWVYDSTGSYEIANVIRMPSGGSRSLVWDGTQFWSLATGQSKLHKHTNIELSNYYESIDVAYTWRYMDGGVATYETTVSPRNTLTMYQRARLSVTGATLPSYGEVDDPNAIGVYACTAGGGTLYLQGTSATDSSALKLSSLSLSSGTASPSANTFPAATPSEIRSAATDVDGALFSMKGDGSGRWGPLTFTSGGAMSHERIAARIEKTAQQSISNASGTQLTFDTAVYANPSGFADLTNDVLTIPEDGDYVIEAGVRFASNATGDRALRIDVGTAPIAGDNGPGGSNSWLNFCSISVTAYGLTSGQTIRAMVYQNSGAALDTSTDTDATYLAARKIS